MSERTQIKHLFSLSAVEELYKYNLTSLVREKRTLAKAASLAYMPKEEEVLPQSKPSLI